MELQLDKCLFCHCDLNPGSVEHLFPSAIGGRVTSRRATCTPCNNSFSAKESDAVDEDLATTFILVRNGLKIWSGRDGPPPTLRRVQTLPDGGELDLAPGFVPVTRPGKLPDTSALVPGTTHRVIGANPEDAKRMLDILEKRGVSARVEKIQSVRRNGDFIPLGMQLNNELLCRAVAKIALVASCVFYGNELARSKCSRELRRVSRYGVPGVMDFSGVDFTNPWPTEAKLTPHSNTPAATQSGFEHYVQLCDVKDKFVAYVMLFGGFQFSVVLGPASGLPSRGLAVNPRSAKPSRFEVSFTPPEDYIQKTAASFRTEFAQSQAGVTGALTKALEVWSQEAREDFDSQLSGELQETLTSIGDDEEARKEAITKYAMRLAAHRMGVRWAEEIDLELNDDGEVVPATKSNRIEG